MKEEDVEEPFNPLQLIDRDVKEDRKNIDILDWTWEIFIFWLLGNRTRI